MSLYTSRHVAGILRDIIRALEQGTDIHPDDPALLELKRILILKISVLEAEQDRSEHGTIPFPLTTEAN